MSIGEWVRDGVSAIYLIYLPFFYFIYLAPLLFWTPTSKDIKIEVSKEEPK
ncbi:hypothetical protein AAEO50_05045 [Rossellomorea oryzaecorticis]|uniref:Uncharacterized protein n=1 Tax=Rossellomorea oryzaecorticis TaxID=1396505 RepID=A0ABU9K6N2_9BACI